MTTDTQTAGRLDAAITAVQALVAEKQAADELITELIAENEQLRTQLAAAQRVQP